MKLYLVRHTRVDVPQGVCYGQTDVPLAGSFATESASLLSALSEVSFEALFCSPLSRCVQLAALFNTPFQRDDRLKELNFGEWEGELWDSIYQTEAGKEWFADYLHEACPEGESYQDMLRRVAGFISDLPQSDGNILVVTHAGVIHAFRVLLENRSLKEAFDHPVAYGQITIITPKRK